MSERVEEMMLDRYPGAMGYDTTSAHVFALPSRRWNAIC